MTITHPWIVDPTTTMIGPLGGDVSSSISKFQAITESGAIPFVDDRITSVGWPEGVPTTPGLDLVSFLSALYLWVASLVIGPVAAHGLLAVLGFSLTAFVTFLFVRRVTGSTGAGLVAGVAYGFFPHMYLVALSATTYAHMWLFVLPLWAFWRFAQEGSSRSALLAAASVLPAVFWTPYYAVHVAAIVLACLVVAFALARPLGLARRRFLLLPLVWIPGAILYVSIGAATSFSDAPDRPLQDFYDQAAHPLMYVIPGYASAWREDMAQTLFELVPRSLHANLYVGVSVILLALVGVVATLVPFVRRGFAARPSPQLVAALMAIAVVVICGLCSLPPRVLDNSIPTPSMLIFEVAPGLRAGQRFVMPLMAGMAVLAGLGAWAILARTPRPVAPLVALALAGVVAADLYSDPPALVAGRMPPSSPAVEALARAPQGPLVHIQEDGLLKGYPQWACLRQIQHGKTLVDVCAFAQAPPTLAREAGQPICKALDSLQARGLRYVITEPAEPVRKVAACFDAGSPLGAHRLLARDAAISVWDLSPEPSQPRN